MRTDNVIQTGHVVTSAAFTLESYEDAFSTSPEDCLVVSWRELEKAKLGKLWGAVGSGHHDEYAEIIYKNDSGCAVLFTTEEDENKQQYLLWFTF